MIGKLSGKIDEINLDHVILDVSGVGYKVFLSSRTLSSLKTGVDCGLNIEMYVREDQMLLYGFSSKLEQKWFNLLQTVQGVGARVALAILSALDSDLLFRAIISDDQRTIKSIVGIGPKLAARIVNELKNHQELSGLGNYINASITSNATSQASESNIFNDALNALANLGFARSEVVKVIADLTKANDNLSLEDIIKLALAKMASNQ